MVSDLLPDARLVPAPANLDEQPARRLAALPLLLDPGEPPASSSTRWSPLGWSLAIAWVCVLIAALAIAVLLSGVISLSERRAAFVSAVTHELRTPLTTFRMYAEMLAENMVTDESQRRAYLDTLRSEAERLSHLVDNVLAYARLERGRFAGARETVSVRAIIERLQERLSLRCRQIDMQLTIEAADDVRQRQLVTDAASVEQIVFNLVDNACKYSTSTTDRRIHLMVNADDDSCAFRVADHGPGIPRSVARRLFQPFTKSAEEAARSASGVGLGLALSRRLARQLGGTLTLEKTDDEGACFLLTLPGLP
jgi:signal transduction histidine kinase